MNGCLSTIIHEIENEFRELIQPDGRNYVEVSICGKAKQMGITDIDERYRHASVIVPIKRPVEGMKVRIDGRTFVNYHQLISGVVIPDYVSKQTGCEYLPYVAQNSMICNFN